MVFLPFLLLHLRMGFVLVLMLASLVKSALLRSTTNTTNIDVALSEAIINDCKIQEIHAFLLKLLRTLMMYELKK